MVVRRKFGGIVTRRRPSTALSSVYGNTRLTNDTIGYPRPEYTPEKTLSDVFDFQTPFVDNPYDPGPAIHPPSQTSGWAGVPPTTFFQNNPLVGDPVETGAISTALQDYLTNLYQDVEGDPAYKDVQRQLDDYALSRKRFEEDAAKDLAGMERQRKDFQFNYGYESETLALAVERGKADYADKVAGLEVEYQQMQREAKARIEGLLDARASKTQLDKNLANYSGVMGGFNSDAVAAAQNTQILSDQPLLDAQASNKEAVMSAIAAITGSGAAAQTPEGAALAKLVTSEQGGLDNVLESLSVGELSNRVAQRNASVTALEAEDAIRLFMEDLRNKELDAGAAANDKVGIEGITQAGENLGLGEMARRTADRQFGDFLTDAERSKGLLAHDFKRQLEEWNFDYENISDGLKRQLEDLGISEGYLTGDFEAAQAAAMQARVDGMTSHDFGMKTVQSAIEALHPDWREPQRMALVNEFAEVQTEFGLYTVEDWQTFLKDPENKAAAGEDAGLFLQLASEYDNAYDAFDAFQAGPKKSDASASGRYTFDPSTLQSNYHPNGYKGQNGQLPSSELVSIGSGQSLAKPAAGAYKAMIEAAAKDGVTFGITDSYRTYQTQVRLANEKGLYSKGGLAAYPGTSDHGAGNALDLYRGGGGKMSSTSAEYKWLVKNAAKYGFSTISREPWHWQFNGGYTATTGSGDRSMVSGSAPSTTKPPSTTTKTTSATFS